MQETSPGERAQRGQEPPGTGKKTMGDAESAVPVLTSSPMPELPLLLGQVSFSPKELRRVENITKVRVSSISGSTAKNPQKRSDLEQRVPS